MDVASSDRLRDSDAATRLGERVSQAIIRGDDHFRAVLDALPAGVYVTDAAGRITYCNEAAVEIWGRRPVLGEDLWCGSWKLFRLDGTQLALDECPMAVTLKTGKPVRGVQAVAERPDGSRIPLIPYPVPLFDASGKLIGGLNLMIDTSDRQETEQRLISIIESSDDAIVSKDLNGNITTWNRGAERLFGYSATEVIGKPVAILIPPDRENEEVGILERIRRGDRVDHYETIRRCKDGRLLDISLTISPIRNAEGRIIGASKIARDITDRKRLQQQQELLVGESKHRIKNTLATVQAIAMQTLRGSSVEERTALINRLHALAAAHDILTVSNWDRARLSDVVNKALSPFREHQKQRFKIDGADVWLNANTSTLLTLALHELATNAAKYGALSNASGEVQIGWEVVQGSPGDRVKLRWAESGGPPVKPPERKGFGSMLIERSLEAQLQFSPHGLVCTMTVTP